MFESENYKLQICHHVTLLILISGEQFTQSQIYPPGHSAVYQFVHLCLVAKSTVKIYLRGSAVMFLSRNHEVFL